MTQYLNQALIELHPDSQIVDLDLTAVAQFSNYVKNKEVNKVSSVAGGPKLEDFLKARLTAQFGTTYDDFFKAFYFAEDGYHPGQGNLSGYSTFGADYVVVFKSKNDQTAAHEILHSLNLAHSFTNKEASSHALFTYEYKKTDNLLDYSHHIGAGGNNSNRCALWYWQWKKANGSIP